jgi:hypothetical protein
MKNFLIKIFFLSSFIFLFANSIQAQLKVGLRDNTYAQIAYEFKNDWEVKLEHSIYLEKFGFQKVRAYMGYNHMWGNFKIDANVYGSTLWNASYQDFGAVVTAGYRIFKPWRIEATINPHYDTQYGYKTCYAASTDVQIVEHFGVMAQYTTIPEYRLSEKRVRAGFIFSYKELQVTPMLSIPVGEEIKSMRILCSFQYTFLFKKNKNKK